MKVWRGFTLIFWTLLLYLCFVVMLLHYSLQGSVLKPDIIKQRLATGNTYDLLRDITLTDRITSVLHERYPGSTLISDPMLKAAVEDAFPRAEVQKRVEPVIDVFYQWLDSKRPDITFEIGISDRLEPFYKALEPRLGQKIASLPACASYSSSPEDALLKGGCLSAYMTAAEATQAAMSLIREEGSPIGTTITAETVALPQAGLGPLRQVPTYLNYLWALYYLMTVVAGLVSIFLLITRRQLGMITIGIAAILAGITMWIVQQMVTAYQPSAEAVLQALQKVFIPPFVETLGAYSFAAVGGGALLVIAALGWRHIGKRRHG